MDIDAEQPHHLHLPEEIIEEILIRLPVKSLLRFSCVSKSWARLIRGKRFITTHLRHNTTSSNRRLIFHSVIITSPEFDVKQYSLQSLKEEDLDYFAIYDFGIVGCCNGMVCIVERETSRFYLWNPSIRISSELPKIDMDGQINSNKYGFGWDSCSDTYKVLVFMNGSDTCKIYSSKTKAWRIVDHPHSEWRFVNRFIEKGVFMSGKLHWQKEIGDQPNIVVKIVTVDLGNEEFGVMDLSRDLNDDRDRTSEYMLGMIGGCLSVGYYRKHIKFDIWVMKEYGVKDSWFKLSCFDYGCIRVDESYLVNWIPLYVGPNEKVFVKSRRSFLVYDKKEEVTLKDHKEDLFYGYGDVFANMGHAYACYESLVSPKRM